MHFVVAKLNEAIANKDLDLARAVIVANFASFQNISHSFKIQEQEYSGDRKQLMIVEELVASIDKNDTIFTCMASCWFALVRLYTNALLLNQYDEEMDKDLATAVNAMATKFWLSGGVQKFEWNCRLYFHQALLALSLDIPYFDLCLRENKSLIDEAERTMPDFGRFCMNVLMTRLMKRESLVEIFTVFNAALKGTERRKYRTGDSVHDMLAGLLYNNAKAFKEYMSVDPFNLPVYIHELFGTIGKCCFEGNEKVLTKTCRAKIVAILTRNAKTFTRFLFRSFGFASFMDWVRDGRLDLLDYSLPGWKTSIGVSLHGNIFRAPPKSKQDIEHLICIAPTHLAVAALKRCECLTLELLNGLPEDRLRLFLQKGALSQLKLAEDEPIPGWLDIEDSDDYLLANMKNSITKQLSPQ